MKPLLLCILPLLLIGCTGTTGTTVWKNGQRVLHTSGDCRKIRLTARGDFSAEVLNHSIPIAARAAGVTSIIRGTGAAVGEGGRVLIRP